MGFKITNYKYDIINRALALVTGENVSVYGNRESDMGSSETWGVNWSALGTVSPKAAMTFAKELENASRLAELLTNVGITDVDWQNSYRGTKVLDISRCAEIFRDYLNFRDICDDPEAAFGEELRAFLAAPPIKPEIIIPDVNGRTNYEHAKACIDANPGINPGLVLVEAMVKGDRNGRRVYLPREDLYKLEDEYPSNKFYPSVPNLREIEDSVSLRGTERQAEYQYILSSYCPEMLVDGKDEEAEDMGR